MSYKHLYDKKIRSTKHSLSRGFFIMYLTAIWKVEVGQFRQIRRIHEAGKQQQ